MEILNSASVKDYLRKAGGKLIAVAERKGPDVAAQNIIQVVTKSTQPHASYHWNRIKEQNLLCCYHICDCGLDLMESHKI